MKLLAVVVLYHPDGDVLANIRTYLPGVDGLLLWDNTPRDCIDRERLRAFQALEKSVYMGKGENVGIGAALNAAVDYARQHGFTHLVTFDQDSRFASDDFGRYLEAVRNWGADARAIFSTNYFIKSQQASLSMSRPRVACPSIICGSLKGWMKVPSCSRHHASASAHESS